MGALHECDVWMVEAPTVSSRTPFTFFNWLATVSVGASSGCGCRLEAHPVVETSRSRLWTTACEPPLGASLVMGGHGAHRPRYALTRGGAGMACERSR